MPAPSCPRIEGKRPSGSPPERVNSSVWQMPVALSSTSTSPALGPSRSTVAISRGLPAAVAIAARVFMAGFPDRGCGCIRKDQESDGPAPRQARGLLGSGPLGREYALGLRRMGRDQVHERRRQTVIGLEAELLEPGAHCAHLIGRCARLDDRGDEGRKARLFPARLLRQLRVEEIEAIERVLLVLDAPVHVYTATGTGIALDRRLLVDDLELVGIRRHRDLVASANANNGESRPLRLPALGTAARMVERDVRSDTHRDRVAGAL